MKCDKCRNTCLRPEPVGYACPICGNFMFDDHNTLAECWTQFKINAQYCQLDGWVNKDLPISKTWALIEETKPPWPELFREYCGCA